MAELSQCSTDAIRRGRSLAAATLAVLLCACAHESGDDVKPTDTTAYHSAQPATPQSETAPQPALPRE